MPGRAGASRPQRSPLCLGCSERVFRDHHHRDLRGPQRLDHDCRRCGLSRGLRLGGGLAGSSWKKGQCRSCLPRCSEPASSGLADRRPTRAQFGRGTAGPRALAPSSSLLHRGEKPVAGGQHFLPPEPLPLPADDTFAFWRGLKDAGLLDEVIQEFHQELVETMRGLQQRVQDPPLQLRGEGALGASSAVTGPGVLSYLRTRGCSLLPAAPG